MKQTKKTQIREEDGEWRSGVIYKGMEMIRQTRERIIKDLETMGFEVTNK